MTDWRKSICNFPVQKVKTLYLHYHNVYSHQTWQVGSSPWWASIQKSHDPLITSSYDITWKDKTIISPVSQCLWSPNLVGWWLILIYVYLNHRATQRSDHILQTHVTNENHIYTTRMPMAPNLVELWYTLKGS